MYSIIAIDLLLICFFKDSTEKKPRVGRQKKIANKGGRPKNVLESSDDDDIYWSERISMTPSSLRNIGCSVYGLDVLLFFIFVYRCKC